MLLKRQFVLWNALKFWLGPSPSYLVNELQDAHACEALGGKCQQKTTKAFHLFSIESGLPATQSPA